MSGAWHRHTPRHGPGTGGAGMNIPLDRDAVARTRKLIEQRLMEAFHVLRCQPAGRYGALRSCLPEVVRDLADMIPAERPALRPSSRAIDRMHEALAWLWVLDGLELKLVSARAQRVRWAQLQRLDPQQRCIRQLKRLHGEALDKILRHLLANEKKDVRHVR